ncbi:hypothetical protein DPMN_054669 [Dreissena polymorpha]|uniref:Uncharacterized protein n=1 Tax=Dreissena polymorpha TaxID=45954 RepID=A0A9D4HRH0_DREPO|nr:hypothetical protein DPMN_054669 [Dreissena polymorpha]
MAQQIQLSPSPSSRTSSSLLRLLSSPGCSGSPNPLFIVESSPARTGPEVPSVEGRVRRESKTTSGKTYGTDSGFLLREGTHEHRRGGFEEGPRGGGT